MTNLEQPEICLTFFSAVDIPEEQRSLGETCIPAWSPDAKEFRYLSLLTVPVSECFVRGTAQTSEHELCLALDQGVSEGSWPLPP